MVEFREYDLTYESRSTIKIQALANFLAKLTLSMGKDAFGEISASAHWTLYIDGFSNKEGSGAGLLLVSSNVKKCSYALCFEFLASNNEAKYEVLIMGMQLAYELGVLHIHVNSDYQLVVRHVLVSMRSRKK